MTKQNWEEEYRKKFDLENNITAKSILNLQINFINQNRKELVEEIIDDADNAFYLAYYKLTGVELSIEQREEVDQQLRDKYLNDIHILE